MNDTDQLDVDKFTDAYWNKFRLIMRSEIDKSVDDKFQGIESRLDVIESQLTEISAIQTSVGAWIKELMDWNRPVIYCTIQYNMAASQTSHLHGLLFLIFTLYTL